MSHCRDYLPDREIVARILEIKEMKSRDKRNKPYLATAQPKLKISNWRRRQVLDGKELVNMFGARDCSGHSHRT